MAAQWQTGLYITYIMWRGPTAWAGTCVHITPCCTCSVLQLTPPWGKIKQGGGHAHGGKRGTKRNARMWPLDYWNFCTLSTTVINIHSAALDSLLLQTADQSHQRDLLKCDRIQAFSIKSCREKEGFIRPVHMTSHIQWLTIAHYSSMPCLFCIYLQMNV